MIIESVVDIKTHDKNILSVYFASTRTIHLDSVLGEFIKSFIAVLTIMFGKKQNVNVDKFLSDQSMLDLHSDYFKTLMKTPFCDIQRYLIKSFDKNGYFNIFLTSHQGPELVPSHLQSLHSSITFNILDDSILYIDAFCSNQYKHIVTKGGWILMKAMILTSRSSSSANIKEINLDSVKDKKAIDFYNRFKFERTFADEDDDSEEEVVLMEQRVKRKSKLITLMKAKQKLMSKLKTTRRRKS